MLRRKRRRLVVATTTTVLACLSTVTTSLSQFMFTTLPFVAQQLQVASNYVSWRQVERLQLIYNYSCQLGNYSWSYYRTTLELHHNMTATPKTTGEVIDVETTTANIPASSPPPLKAPTVEPLGHWKMVKGYLVNNLVQIHIYNYDYKDPSRTLRKFGDGGVRKGGVAQICRKFLRKILRKIVSSSCISMSRHQQPMLSQWNDSNFPHLKVSSRWMSTTHSETHCDRHHELQTALREVAEILRKFCGNCGHFSEFGSTAPAKAAEILRKFSGNSLKCAEKFSARGRSANPTSRCMRQCELQKFRKGAFTKGALRKFLRKFCASFASSSFREEGCAKLCANLYANWKSISDKFMQIPLFQCPHLRISERLASTTLSSRNYVSPHLQIQRARARKNYRA